MNDYLCNTETTLKAQPKNAEAHTSLTGTNNRTGHITLTDTHNTPRHTHNKQKDPYHIQRYTHF